MAQLVAHLSDTQVVNGSSPFASITLYRGSSEKRNSVKATYNTPRLNRGTGRVVVVLPSRSVGTKRFKE